MEPQGSSPTARSARRVGVLLAGVGGVGEAFTHVLQQRFCTAELEVRLVAIGDSKGFVVVSSSGQQTLEWSHVAAIIDHKKRGHSVPSSVDVAGLSEVQALNGLTAALHHFHTQRVLDDYVVVDCTTSRAIAPALIEAKQLGFAVIMANKLPVGGPFEQYQQLTYGEKGRVRYEATVGAGVPVINVVQRIVASKDSIQTIEGGLSGTITYILSAMNRGESFSTGLKEVHELGITENDPREDLSGADVGRKMVILAREMGIAAEASNIEIIPLLPKEAFDLPVDNFMRSLHLYDDAFKAQWEAASRTGHALAYIGTVHADGRIRIGLERVPPNSLFATASSTEGVVSITSDWFPEPLMIRGTGAGAASTAAAIAGDLAAILR